MKLIFKYATVALLICTLTACPGSDVKNSWFIVENESLQVVYVLEGRLGAQIDTLFPNVDSSYLTGPIHPHESRDISRNKPSNMDSMCIFIINADTLKKYTWNEIKSGYKIVQRYDLDIKYEELRKLNYKICYPPTENMKNIHMYPPYATIGYRLW